MFVLYVSHETWPLLYRHDADGEANVIVAVAKAGAGNAGNARFFKELEDIFARAHLAPVVDGGVVVQVDARKQVMALVKLM